MINFENVINLRAKRGFASQKAALVKEYKMLVGMAWHYVILATGNAGSTYNGLYPQTIAKARDEHMSKIEAVKAQIKEICHES